MDTQKAAREAKVMSDITAILSNLEIESIHRILNWANSVYNLNEISKAPAQQQLEIFDLPTYYSMKNPRTDREKTLVVCYWLQFYDNNELVDALTVNKALGRLGQKVLNITRAFHLLQNTQLVSQIKKSSLNKQVKILYKVTLAGKKLVDEM